MEIALNPLNGTGTGAGRGRSPSEEEMPLMLMPVDEGAGSSGSDPASPPPLGMAGFPVAEGDSADEEDEEFYIDDEFGFTKDAGAEGVPDAGELTSFTNADTSAASQAPVGELPDHLQREFTLEEFLHTNEMEEDFEKLDPSRTDYFTEPMDLLTKIEARGVEWPADVKVDPYEHCFNHKQCTPKPHSDSALSKFCFDRTSWNILGTQRWVWEIHNELRKNNDGLTDEFEVQNELMTQLVADRPNWKFKTMREECIKQLIKLKARREELQEQLQGEHTAMKTAKEIQLELKQMDDQAREEIVAAFAEKIEELHLKTLKPRPSDYFARDPLRIRRKKYQAQLERDHDLLKRAESHNYTSERLQHWAWFGDRPYHVSEEEEAWEREQEVRKNIAQRRGRWGFLGEWNLLEGVSMKVEKWVGRATGQIFVFYKLIMINNFIMSNMWTLFVIVPYLIDPPKELVMDDITWIGLLGLDDKAMEYSWFYYGAYKATIDMGFMTYRMDVAYVLVIIAMLVFQLGGMAKGVYDSFLQDRTAILITDDPLEGIHFSATLICSFNHGITDAGVQDEHKVNVCEHLVHLLDDSGRAQVNADFERPEGMTEEEARLIMEAAEGSRNKGPNLILGRIVGVIMYIALFQISTNGIRACYENEEAIGAVLPYGVPVLVTSMRVLVPFLLVPLFLKLEQRTEPNNFYHMIVRMFLLKMYTMNILLQIIISIEPPAGLCRVIYIGKVYWRQEIVDLLFTMLMDAYMCYVRLRKPKRPEFDLEELAERVMELLYRQAFIWVSAPYSPMLAYLAIMSTTILFFFQGFTVTLSYTPAVHAWANDESNRLFRVLLLLTALATFYPTWTFLHQPADCGPHVASVSPYDFMKTWVASLPEGVQVAILWSTIPTTTCAWLIISITLAIYRIKSAEYKGKLLNHTINAAHLEYLDKAQLLRSQDILY